MNNTKVINDHINYIVKKQCNKFVGVTTNTEMFDFHFDKAEMPKVEKSNITTINPIKL